MSNSQPPRGKPSTPSERKGRATVSFWCPEALIRKIDERAAELQRGRIARVHRPDVIKAILAREFDIDLSTLKDE